jgi:hypothetical protein
MLKRTAAALAAIMMIGGLAFISVSPAAAGGGGGTVRPICNLITMTVVNTARTPGIFQVTIVRDPSLIQVYSVNVTLAPGQTKLITVLFYLPANTPGTHASVSNISPGVIITNTTSISLPLGRCVGVAFTDHRLNSSVDQQGAPVALYCAGDGSVEVWDIDPDTAQGALAFLVPAVQITDGLSRAAAGDGSVKIAEGMGDSLWATPEGGLVVVGPDMREPGKTYQFDFAADTCG